MLLHKIRPVPRKVFKPSAYNLIADTPEGDVVVANTLSGSQVLFPKTCRDEATALLSAERTEITDTNSDLVNQLADVGVLVPEDSNERRKLRYLQNFQTSSTKNLQVIIFPTEKCNFRCVYCYEDFEQGKMAPETRLALKKYLLSQVKSLASLQVDWFGGEPLLAFDVMRDILPEVKAASKEFNCRLTGHITTNGYLLTPEIATQLLDWNVFSYQITLDGPCEEHNKRRLLYKAARDSAPQDGTFQRIFENVEALLGQQRIFHLQLRTNYDLDSLPVMESWIDTLASKFARDPRVRVDFCPIWADPCKVDVSVPMGPEKQRTHSELLAMADAKGLRTNAPDYMSLGGMVCYAAKANSMVIRSDGSINKCTVALDADYNHVGEIRADGSLDIDLDKFARWTSSGLEEDTTCQGCAVSPSCQGNACPLERFENNRRPCPPLKNFTPIFVNMAARNH